MGIAFFCSAFICLCGVFAVNIKNTNNDERYLYFLIDDRSNAEAGAILSKFQGGAGYLLALDGAKYAVHSVYLQIEEGRRAEKENEDVRLLNVAVFNAQSVCFDVIEVLLEVVQGLENSWTQESAKRVLLDISTVARGLFRSSVQYTQPYKNLLSLQNGIVLSKDVRYVACSFANAAMTNYALSV